VALLAHGGGGGGCLSEGRKDFLNTKKNDFLEKKEVLGKLPATGERPAFVDHTVVNSSPMRHVEMNPAAVPPKVNVNFPGGD